MGPFAILAIVVAVIIILLLVALVIVPALSGGGDDKNAAADPLAGKPGHDHSKGADNCPACKAASKPVDVKVPEKCIVRFRPKTGWAGEFGCDWLREGDTGLSGDVDYSTKIQDNKFASLRDSNYKTIKSTWKKDTAGADYIYVVPWLYLFPPDQCVGNTKKSEAKLTLYIEVVSKEPEVLRLEYDKTLFELDKQEVTPKTVGTNKMELTIKCLKEFDKDQEIDIYPYKEGKDSLAGRIIVIKNNKANRYMAKVVFINVTTKINDNPKVGSIPAAEKEIFKQQFYQALITIDTDSASASASLDLSADAVLKSSYTVLQGLRRALVSNPAGKISLHNYLINKFNNDDTIKKSGIDYSSYLKIFCFDELGGINNGGTYQGAGGEASGIPSPIKTVTVYDLHKTTAPVHEFLHAIGLCHTFETVVHVNNKYTFLPFKCTDNIMDYSDVRQSTWKWQWDILQASPDVKKEA